MDHSEQLNELAKALAKCQGENDRFAESILIPKINRCMNGIFKCNKVRPLFDKFIEKIFFGRSDCWYFGGSLDNGGYGMIERKKSHRVSWNLFNGEIPKGMNVLHKCDVRNCVNPDHLFLGTQKDNVLDMCIKKRNKSNTPLGEKNHLSKLKGYQVFEMREIYARGGISYKKLAEKYGISAMTAFRAVTKQSWRHHENV